MMRKPLITLLSAFIGLSAFAQDDLSAEGASNCYVVSQSGQYKFKAVRGNGVIPVENIISCEILWESSGGKVAPRVGELVRDAACGGSYICFTVPEPFSEGNAVIAAKDVDGKVLWSWHIWLAEKPASQTYVDGSVFMDRNLGALSASPLSHESYGLLYQWGRKDPFLGTCVGDDNVLAASTKEWPLPVKSDAAYGTMEYAVAHPQTFISGNKMNSDWQYEQCDTRWAEEKTIYDPCPPGWKVPSGCFGGFGKYFEHPFVGIGIDFKGKFSESDSIWFPATGYRYYYDGTLYSSGLYGNYWFAGTDGFQAEYMFFYFSSGVYPVRHSPRASAYSVRCITE